MSDLQVVIFSLNDEVCATNTLRVQEIVKYQEMSKLPEMPDFLSGVINLRGKVIPVIDLNTRFNIGKTEITKKTRIIITIISERLVGFIVNEVSEIIKFTDADIEPAPLLSYNGKTQYLDCVGKRGDLLVSILNLEKVLIDNEINKIGEIV